MAPRHNMAQDRRNPFRLTVAQLVEQEGYEDQHELLYETKYTPSVPALCSQGCEVEVDGTCSHGCPSVWLALGLV